MRYEPRFDDPSRTADYGFFPRERIKPPKVTGDDLADAIRSGSAPEGAPFRDWVPALFEGWRFDVHIEEARQIFKAMLNNDGTYTVAMDVLSDVAFEKYGADYE